MTDFNLSENAYKVLHKRYLLKDDQGNVVETPSDMFRRVAKHVANGDLGLEDKFFDLMTSLKFVPNSPTLTGAGRNMCLSACFVLNPEDDLHSIFETQLKAAEVFKEGGGVGYDFSALRPKNSKVKSTQGVSSGPISFMKSYDSMCHAIKQGGTRRGAQMGVLRIDHPDVEEFITSKDKENTVLSNFNISIGVSDEFMDAVKSDSQWILKHPAAPEIQKEMSARELLRLVATRAHDTGDPGLLFLDRANKDNPILHIGKYRATNPCGEQFLVEGDSCTLGSMNVTKYYDPDTNDIDWDILKEDIHLCMKFLDQVVETNKFPLPEIDRVSRGTRRVGLGIMGWAQLLFLKQIPYNSKQANVFIEKFMKFFRNESVQASIDMGKRMGSFPFWQGSIYDKNDNVPSIYSDYMPSGVPVRIRNANQNTIAPTGSISLIANCSSGMEPVYALVYEKDVMDGTRLFYVDPIFKAVAKAKGFYSKELIEKISDNGGSCQGISEVPKNVQKIFITAMDLTPEEHVTALATFQKYIDSSISKTINLPSDATIDDVEEVYELAYEMGCKGVTVFRDGCKSEQVLYTGKKDKRERGRSKIGINDNILKKLLIEKKMSVEEAADVFDCSPSTVRRRMKEFGIETNRVRPTRIQRPDILKGDTQKLKTGEGTFFVTSGTDEIGDLIEILITPSKSSKSEHANCEAMGRLISLLRQYGVPVEEIGEQLDGISGENPTYYNGLLIKSLPDALSKILYRFSDKDVKVTEGTCKSCGSANVEFSSGCYFCRNCGDGKCG